MKKIKKLLHSKSSSFYVVKMLFLSYDCSFLGSFPLKTVFAMLYIKWNLSLSFLSIKFLFYKFYLFVECIKPKSIKSYYYSVIL